MSIFLGALATDFALGIITNLASNVLWDAKAHHDGEKKSEQIRQRIADFNRKYDDTPLDSSEFQLFFSERVVAEIFNAVFKPQVTNGDYITSLPLQAFDAYRNRCRASGRTLGCDIGLFKKYFGELIVQLNSIRTELLSLEHASQTTILAEIIHQEAQTTRDFMRLVHGMQSVHFESISNPMSLGDNIFARPVLNEIEALINNRAFDEAELKIADILEEKALLSSDQIEFIYYQRARVLINSNRHNALNDVIEKIRRINPNSKFIHEINYFIACDSRDNAMLNASIEALKQLGYTPEKCLLKEANYLMILQDYGAVRSMLLADDELISLFDRYHEAHFYCGLLMANSGKFSSAFYHFEKAYALRNMALYKYYAAQSEFYGLGDDAHGIYFRPADFIDKAKALRDQLKGFDYLVASLGQEASVNHFVNLLNLAQIIDPNEAIREIEHMDPLLLENVLVKSVVADIYLKHGEIDKAGPLLANIWDFSLHNALNYFIVCQEDGNWVEIIRRYRAFTDDEYLTNPNIRAIYIQAMVCVEGYENAKSIIVALPNEDLIHPQYVCKIVNILLTQKDTDEYYKFLARINEQKNALPIDVLILLSSLLIEHRLFDDVLNLCKERAQEDDLLTRQYIYALGGNVEDDPSSMPYVYDEVTRIYNTKNRSKTLLSIKAKIENRQSHYTKAIKTLDEYRALYGMDNFYAYYYAATKYEAKEFDNLDEQCRHLLVSDMPMLQQLVAIIWARTGRWQEAKRLAVAVLYKNHENVSKEFYGNFVNMFFANVHQDAEEPELTQAVPGSLITLESYNDIRKVAIHSDSALVDHEGERKFGFENYTELDTISLLLTSRGRLNKAVTISNEKYIVKEIIRLPGAFVRYCLEKLQTEYPDHGFFKVMASSSTEELWEKMKEAMQEIKKGIERYLAWYNFQNFKSGLPISALSGHDIEKYTQTIISLLNHEGQHFFAGEVSIFDKQEYVLSLSSIIVLSVLGVLDRLKSIPEKVCITNAVDLGIRQGVLLSQQKSKVIAGYAFTTNDGELGGYPYTEEDKEANNQFWSDILSYIQSFSKHDVEMQENEYYTELSDWMLKEDFSSIELSKVQKKVLVIDDLFVRKISHAVAGSSNTTNSIGFLVSEGLVDPEELLDIVLKLVKFKYVYPVSEPIIVGLLNYIFSIEDDEKRDQQFDKMKAVFKEILSKESRNFYQEMLLAIQRRDDLPSAIKYELVREPLGLMPWDQLVRKQVRKMLGVDDGSENGQDELL